MNNLLQEICNKKRAEVAAAKSITPLSKLTDVPTSPPRGFQVALQRAAPFGIIAEIKKASPSAGVIRPDFDPATIAKDYASAGAACLSVLTDTPYFQGNSGHLQTARTACALPVLRKDFMVDVYQVYEARSWGADCILLIMAAVDDVLAAELHAATIKLGMDVLIEVHDEKEMERALKLPSGMIGINNRNLSTLQVNLETTQRLASLAPPGRVLISESGIQTHADIKKLSETCGVKNFLVGESLLKQPNTAEALRTLLSG